MQVAIQYMIPLTVFVDTETKEVERVLQENENMFLPDMPDVYDVDRSWNPIIDETLKEEVIDIVQDNEWPVWDVA
jgi:hypothetical protein